MGRNGWGSRTRTYESRSQSPLPYRLAIPHRLIKNGEPTGIRTPDTRLRRPLLYPTELWTHMERMMRIELTLSAWKAEVLPLNYIRIKNWSGRRDSNSRPSPWQGDALPLSHFRIIGRGRWIRTIESSANGFTVRPLWPLGNPSINKYWSWWRESNPQPADYKSAALPLSHTSESLKKLATWNGLEPSTSSVTGWHSNQLNYQAIIIW